MIVLGLNALKVDEGRRDRKEVSAAMPKLAASAFSTKIEKYYTPLST